MSTDLNEEEILQVLKIVDQSNVDELCLETANLKLIIKKSAGNSTIQVKSINAAGVVPPSAIKLYTRAPTTPILNPDPASPKTADAIPQEKGLLPVKAPVLGIFYRAPGPGAEPFVKEGSKVTKNTVVSTIEVMKVFTSVYAGIDGIVTQVCVENGATVEYGQTLFYVRPEGAS